MIDDCWENNWRIYFAASYTRHYKEGKLRGEYKFAQMKENNYVELDYPRSHIDAIRDGYCEGFADGYVNGLITESLRFCIAWHEKYGTIDKLKNVCVDLAPEEFDWIISQITDDIIRKALKELI